MKAGTPSDTNVISQDIPDACRRTSRTGLGLLPGLVVAIWVDRVVAEELAGEVEDADVAVVDEDSDAGSGEAAADAEVADLAGVADGEFAVEVDGVAS
jgi:hypothetical protein